MESPREGSGKSQAKRVGAFFSKLTASSLDDFSVMEYPSTYSANVVLFTEGEPVRAVFVILEGEVRLSINSSDGKHLSLRVARKGDIVGLSESLSGSPYNMTAETLCVSNIAPIERSEFLKFLTRHPDAYHAVTEEMARHMTIACSQLRTLGLSSSAPEKLARLLLEWSDPEQAPGHGSRLFSLTHEEIAGFIGTSRETVTRTLSKFKNRHLVTFKGSRITIPSRPALAVYARISLPLNSLP